MDLYREALEGFYRWEGKEEGPGTAGELLDYIGMRKEQGWAGTTINIHLRALRTYFKWATAQGLIEKDPAVGIPLAREKRTLLPTLTSTDLQALFRAAKGEHRNAERNSAILAVMLDTGCRPGELLSLRMLDLNLAENCLRVRGKCGERQLPISPATRKALLSWLRKRPDLPGEAALFMTNRGEGLSKLALRSLLLHLGKKAGLSGERIYAYKLRHTAATSYLQAGADLEVVRRLLGHTTLSVTQRYLSLTQADLARSQRKYSPVNRWR